MPWKPRSRCTRCRRLFDGTGRCPECKAQQNREIDRARGSAAARGYAGGHVDRFRPGVLAKNPICVLCWSEPATVADHWPKSRRELEALGLDPNDPAHGRGLCATCHNRETAKNQPGGWNRR